MVTKGGAGWCDPLKATIQRQFETFVTKKQYYSEGKIFNIGVIEGALNNILSIRQQVPSTPCSHCHFK